MYFHYRRTIIKLEHCVETGAAWHRTTTLNAKHDSSESDPAGDLNESDVPAEDDGRQVSSQPDARFLGHVHASFLAVFDQFALDLRAWHSKMWKGLQTAMFDISWPPEHSCLLVFGKLPGLTEIDLVHLAIVRNDPSRKLLRRIFNGVHLGNMIV